MRFFGQGQPHNLGRVQAHCSFLVCGRRWKLHRYHFAKLQGREHNVEKQHLHIGIIVLERKGEPVNKRIFEVQPGQWLRIRVQEDLVQDS